MVNAPDPGAAPPVPAFDAGRAAVYAIGIGVPIAAGFAFDSPSTALFAGVGALAALFTDPRRGFASRLVFIALAMNALLVAGVLGDALRPYPHVALVATAVAAFPAGLVPPAFAYLTIVAKLVPLALIVVATDTFTGAAVPGGFLAGTVFATATTMIEATLRRGASASDPLREMDAIRRGTRNDFAYALAFTGAVAIALGAAHALAIDHPLWAVVTALFVMHPERQEAMRRVSQRIAGTVVGVAAAWLVVRSGAPVAAVVALTVAVAAFIPWGLARGQFHRSLAITIFVLLLFDVGMIADGGDAPLISARLWDTLIGAGAVALASAVLQLWRRTRSGTTEAPPARAPAAEADGAGRPAEPGEPSGPR